MVRAQAQSPTAVAALMLLLSLSLGLQQAGAQLRWMPQSQDSGGRSLMRLKQRPHPARFRQGLQLQQQRPQDPQQVQQLQAPWQRQEELSALVQDLPCIPSGIAIAGIARTTPDSTVQFHLDAWMATANRRAYSSAQNATAYVATHALSSRHPSWDKIVLADVVLQHSCPEWVWLLDISDAFIMNLNVDLRQVIDEAVQAWRSTPPAGKNMTLAQWTDAIRGRPYPDVLVARDCNGVNAGSLIVRNSPWGRRHLAEIWATDYPEVPHLSYWWEQAGIRYLLERKPGVEERYHFIEQHLINAYPHASCGQVYQEGDIAVHMPGIFKDALAFESGWLNKVPLHSTVDPKQRLIAPRVYHVIPLDEAGQMPPHTSEPHRGLPAGPAVNITWMKRTLADGSQQPHQLVCLSERRHLLKLNPGWPVPEPPLVSHITAAYRSEVKLRVLLEPRGLEARHHDRQPHHAAGAGGESSGDIAPVARQGKRHRLNKQH